MPNNRSAKRGNWNSGQDPPNQYRLWPWATERTTKLGTGKWGRNPPNAGCQFPRVIAEPPVSRADGTHFFLRVRFHMYRTNFKAGRGEYGSRPARPRSLLSCGNRQLTGFSRPKISGFRACKRPLAVCKTTSRKSMKMQCQFFYNAIFNETCAN